MLMSLILLTVNVSGLVEQLSAIQANQVGKVAEVKTALDLQTQAVVDLATATNAETAKIAELEKDLVEIESVTTEYASYKELLYRAVDQYICSELKRHFPKKSQFIY